MRRLSSSTDSSAALLLLSKPSTTALPLGTRRSGSKPPARAVSYSRKNVSTLALNSRSATGS